MKILVISGSLPPIRCGVGDYTRSLLENMRTSLHSVSVISSSHVADIEGYTLTKVRGWGLQNIMSLFRLVQKATPDIVHIQYPTKGYGRALGINLLPLILRAFTGKRLVVTLHEYYSSSKLGRLRSFITIVACHKVVVSNSADVESLPGFLHKKTVVIPIGSSIPKSPSNPSRFKNILKKAGLTNDKPTLGFFGFAFPAKNLEVLVEAMSSLNSHNLLLMTSFDKENTYHTSIQNMIERVNKESGEKTIGVSGYLEASDVSVCLQECQAFVLPSSSVLTARSSSAIAAVKNSCPTIAYGGNNPRINEPFIANRNSVILPEMSSSSLVEAIQSLSPNTIESIKSELPKLSNYFSWETIVDKHKKLYSSITKGSL